MKKILLAGLLLAPIMAFAQSTATVTTTMVGGDRDSHGCIPSAGYVWSEANKRCERPWENKVNLTCINAAVDKRENSLISAHDTFNSSVKSALETRKSALKDMWAIADKNTRNSKKSEAYKNFKNSTQSAHSAMRSARVSAWSVFNTEMKACGITNHGEKAQTISVPTSSL